MGPLVIILLVTTLFGILFGAFLTISFAIRREDRSHTSFDFDAPDASARAARSLVGMSSSR